MIRFALPSLLLLAACATTPADQAREAASNQRTQAKLSKQLAGYTPGKPVDCIDPNATNVQIYGDTLLYRNTSGRFYLTQTTGGCFGLKRDDIIVSRSFSGRLCQGDILRTVDRTSGFPSGACSYGQFVPYVRDRHG